MRCMNLYRFLTPVLAVVFLAGCVAKPASPPPPKPPTFDETVSITINSLQEYWAIKTKYTAKPYVGPRVLSYDSPDDHSCGGRPAFLDNARMCFIDNTVSFDVNYYKKNFVKYGPIFVYYITGHEYAHSVQGHVDQRGPDDRFFETQADCMAGAYIGEMYRLGRIPLTQDDLINVRTIVYSVGDDAPGRGAEGKPSNPDGHGTGDERYTAFYTGYTQGVPGCKVKDVG